jgi:hypothetical protein
VLRTPKFGREVVGVVLEVVVVTWVQHEDEWHPDLGDLGQPPAVVQPDAFVASPTGPAVRGILAMARRLRNHRWSKLGDPQALGLARADVPACHPGQR